MALPEWIQYAIHLWQREFMYASLRGQSLSLSGHRRNVRKRPAWRFARWP
jgi:hypothetical protein